MKTINYKYSVSLIPAVIILILLSYSKGIAQSGQISDQTEIFAVLSSDRYPYRNALDGIEDYLRSTGSEYILRRIRVLTERDSDSDVIDEIRQVRPGLILAIGTNAARLTTHNIKDIPIVVSMVLSNSFIGSDQNNVTGVSLTIPPEKQFEIIKQVMPDLSSMGVLYNVDENRSLVNSARNAAKNQNIDLIGFELRNEREVPRTFQNALRFTDAVWLIIDSYISRESRKYIINEGLKSNVPIIGFGGNTVEEGALLAISCTDYFQAGNQAGRIVSVILNGIRPGRIPFESPEKITLIINDKLAKELGKEFPERITGISSIIYK